MRDVRYAAGRGLEKMKTGKCLQCGKCCQTKFLLKGMSLKLKIVLHFAALLKGKRIRATDKCCFLAFENGKAYCKNYAGRPDFCRAFPEEKGDLVEGCGYSFIEEIKVDKDILKKSEKENLI